MTDEAVIATAGQALETAQLLHALLREDREKVSDLGRAAKSTRLVHRALLEHPICNSGWLVNKTGLTAATVNKCLGNLAPLVAVARAGGRGTGSGEEQ